MGVLAGQAGIPSGSSSITINNHHTSSKRRLAMRAKQMLKQVAVLMCAVAVGVSAQTTRNRGTIVNTSTWNVVNLQNYQGATGGKISNNSTINVTGNLTNGDGAGATGVIHNQYAAGAGTINVNGNYANADGTTFNSNASSLIRVGGALTNTTAANFSTDTGTVDYKAAAAQTVLQTVKNNTYGGLTLSGGGGFSKTLGGSVTVEGLVTIAASTDFAVGASNTLTVNAASPFATSGTFTADASNATVVYNRNGAQNVTTGSYYNLTLATGGTKTVNTGSGTLSVAAGGTLLNNTTFDLDTYAFSTGATSVITNTGQTIRTKAGVTFGASHTIAGTFIYENATTSQSIGGATYQNLTLQSGSGASGQKNFNATTVNVSGTYAASGANRNYGTGTIAYVGTGASATQSVLGGESYYNLTISGAADTTFGVGGYKQASAALTATNGLTIAANNVLDMQNFGLTAPGTNANSGKIRWAGSNTFVTGTGMTEFYHTSGSVTVADNAGYGRLLFSGAGSSTIGTLTTGPGTGAGVGLYVTASGATVTVGTSLTVNGDIENDGTIINNGTVTVN
jgi:hypothetical protein